MLTEIELFVIEKVKELRIQLGLTQSDLAFKIGVSSGFIGKVESQKNNSKYNLNHINLISKALNVSPGDLLPKTSL